MSSQNKYDINPGQALKLFLKELYPPSQRDQTCSIFKMDDALASDGRLFELAYESSINYLIRRLLTTTEYLSNKFNPAEYPSGRYIEEVRRFLKEYTHIPRNKTEKLLILLLDCLREKFKEPSATTKRNLIRRARDTGQRCYICGCSLDFEQENLYNSAIIEHVWPRSLGGASDNTNLRVSCKRCSEIKSNYIDVADFHYEEICLSSDKNSVHFFNSLEWEYRIAILMKNSFSCVICGKEPAYEGELEFCRQETEDSWHFLNVDTYCSQHARE
ncbi:HNH endonuclease [Trichocoleus sp. DQ-A3]|uniref:HNH endonuclease n=1 Tax=Cyanophyceae TaxID=3028117 RepID=UPI001688866D|nr:HNH endonuclease [Coleofasciculus sp. FACHB-125]MBD1899181.1 HNH endonuclease [Coleofasciculus sp. FACHB-125]